MPKTGDEVLAANKSEEHDLEYLPRDAYSALYDQVAEVKRMRSTVSCSR